MESSEYTFAIYSVFFFFATMFSLLINSIFLRFAKTLGIRDTEQTVIRWSSVSKPALGGITFFIVFLIAAAVHSIFFEQAALLHNKQALGLLAATSLAFLMGLADDAYNTRPLLKLFVQIACSVILIATGTYIQVFENVWMNYGITVFWVVALMNSINMLDNMDAITSVVSIFIIISALVYMYLQGLSNNMEFIILIGVLASLIGFLFFNWHPSKMYMGDTGSQFLGIFLATIGINYFWNSKGIDGSTIPAKQVITAILVFLLPIVDTTTVVINRLFKGQSPFVGGKDHTTHHLSYLGLTDSQVAMVFIGLSILSFFLVFAIFKFIPHWSLLLTLLFIGYFLLVFGILFYITKIKQKDKEDQ